MESMSDHAAVSAEAAAFRARMSEAGRALTGPGVDHALMYGGTRKAAPEPASPHKMRPAGSDRVSINGGVEHTPKQKKHFESHISSEHVDAAFKASAAGVGLAFGQQGDAGSFSVAGGRGMARRKYAHGTHTTSADFAGVFRAPPEDKPPAGAGAGYESPAAARPANRRLNTPYDVNESYFEHPLSPGSKVGHDHARHSHQTMLGEEWRAQRDATNPITGTDTRTEEWRAKLGRDPTMLPQTIQTRNVLTGALRDNDVHTHIIVGSSSLGHWHTAVSSTHGKQRNEEVHAAVAAAQIAHTEGGIVHAPPAEPDPEVRRGTLYELVEKRLAEARARSATPVHPSRVNASPALFEVLQPADAADAAATTSKPPSVAALAATDEEQDTGADHVAGTPTRTTRRRSAAVSSKKVFPQGKTKVINL